jgi:hypothetical protein
MSYVVFAAKESHILWGCTEDKVYDLPLANSLQERNEMRAVENADTNSLHKACDEFTYRLVTVWLAYGANIEHL